MILKEQDNPYYLFDAFGKPVYAGDYVIVKNFYGDDLRGELVRIEQDRFIIKLDNGTCNAYFVTNDMFIEVLNRADVPTENDGFIENDDSIKMSIETFQHLLDELDGNSLQTLKEKNARYSSEGDALHNFRSGADIAGGTPAQACWGYMTKHLVALRDMVLRDDFSNRDDFLEKCQDTINYIRFLWCIGNENSQNKKE